MNDDRPPDDGDYPRHDPTITLAWCPSDDMLEEIIKQGREVCDEPV
jgi:hypothetical protein